MQPWQPAAIRSAAAVPSRLARMRSAAEVVHAVMAQAGLADTAEGRVQARAVTAGGEDADPFETLGAEAGVALLDRGMRLRYPFVQVH